MKYRFAFSVFATIVAGGCSGGDATSPMSSGMNLGDAQAVVSASRSAARSGTLHAVKECTGFTGGAGSFCEITESNVTAIELGSRIYYLNPPAVFTPTGSDVILDLPGPGNNAAFGHCALNLATNTGLCTFSGGTGKFKWFEGRFDISDPSALSWDVDGAYSFDNNGRKD